jgi:hypothetical protein
MEGQDGVVHLSLIWGRLSCLDGVQAEAMHFVDTDNADCLHWSFHWEHSPLTTERPRTKRSDVMSMLLLCPGRALLLPTPSTQPTLLHALL